MPTEPMSRHLCWVSCPGALLLPCCQSATPAGLMMMAAVLLPLRTVAVLVPALLCCLAA